MGIKVLCSLVKVKLHLIGVSCCVTLHFTYFPSTTLKLESQIGKHPQATTRSVGVTAPRRRKRSNTRTIPGRMSGRAGQTVNTLWSIWKDISQGVVWHEVWLAKEDKEREGEGGERERMRSEGKKRRKGLGVVGGERGWRGNGEIEVKV